MVVEWHSYAILKCSSNWGHIHTKSNPPTRALEKLTWNIDSFCAIGAYHIEGAV